MFLWTVLAAPTTRTEPNEPRVTRDAAPVGAPPARETRPARA
jgi:hypothetical protein